ncbi:arsenite methyltransferase [Haloarchaeobius sp. HRN-SO-5]|uniref:arsenite methyltransferase n=1 Tax=Haloarchaeobius sp. HRN-SO-5 TaxID=3446118 RepID=UPI003EB933D0
MSEESRSGRTPEERTPDETRRIVRDRYAQIATADDDDACCSGSDDDSCCDDSGTESEQLGYDADDVSAVADGADLGLGCGNPRAIADLSPGESVLDLGSGAGFDCFLAAAEVGESGTVVGVDMTPEMVTKARENVAKNDASNVEFRLGEIEHLPVADETVDVVISNCVVNLSPEKRQVFAEAFRVLEPGGRLAISDVVQTAPFPDDVRTDPESLAACVSGASTVDRLESMLEDVGFVSVDIAPKDESEEFISEWDDERDLSEYLVSATIEGVKPGSDSERDE